MTGDRAHRGELVPRVQDLGYTVVPVRERELVPRAAQNPGPAAVIVCLGTTDASRLVQALRQRPETMGIPVLLYGRLQGETPDLAAVLELGADRFLEAPVDEAELKAALVELAGPPAGTVRTEVREASPAPRPVRADPVLSRLHHTLEVLAARLETREESVDGHRDGIDLEAMGLDAVPDVDPEHDSGELELLREPTQRLPSTGESRIGRRGTRSELTFSRDGEISPEPGPQGPAEAHSDHTASVATAAREDVRKDRASRGDEGRTGPRAGTGNELSRGTWPKRQVAAGDESRARLRSGPGQKDDLAEETGRIVGLRGAKDLAEEAGPNRGAPRVRADGLAEGTVPVRGEPTVEPRRERTVELKRERPTARSFELAGKDPREERSQRPGVGVGAEPGPIEGEGTTELPRARRRHEGAGSWQEGSGGEEVASERRRGRFVVEVDAEPQKAPPRPKLAPGLDRGRFAVEDAGPSGATRASQAAELEGRRGRFAVTDVRLSRGTGPGRSKRFETGDVSSEANAGEAAELAADGDGGEPGRSGDEAREGRFRVEPRARITGGGRVAERGGREPGASRGDRDEARGAGRFGDEESREERDPSRRSVVTRADRDEPGTDAGEDPRGAEEATIVLPSRHWARRPSPRGEVGSEMSRETWPQRHARRDIPEESERDRAPVHEVRGAAGRGVAGLSLGAGGQERARSPIAEVVRHARPAAAEDAETESPLAGAESRGETEAPALLAELRRERFTGCLRVVVSGAPARRLWWSEGQVIGGASAASSESVLGRLAARGLLSPAHVELAARWGTGDPRRDVERLAQSALIKPQEMREALREPVRRIVERIAESGSVAWGLDPGETPAVAVELGVPLAAMIAGGVQRGATLSQLRVAVNDDRRPRLAFAGPEALAAELRWPAVVAVTERFDGQTRVAELVAAAVADEATIRGIVHVLELLGHLAPEIDDPAASLTALDRQRVRERLRLARESDYFALLGLPREASRAEVLRAHADLTTTFCESLEPDSRVELAEEIEELMAALDEARDVLSDDALHSAYLAQIGAT